MSPIRVICNFASGNRYFLGLLGNPEAPGSFQGKIPEWRSI